jgi:tetratricopeptide (TPR) repeat protein
MGMNAAPRMKFLIVCLCLVLSPWIFAAELDTFSSSQSTNAAAANTLNAYLQIQEQLHETQLAIASNRQETAAALAQNADAMTARIQLLEQTIAGQRASDVESARKTQQVTLALAGVGMLGLAVMLLIVYFQLRAATRLVELAVSSPALNISNGRALPVVESGELPASARAAIEFTNAKLLGAVERLERRIQEMEQTARAPLNETASSANHEQNGAHAISSNGSQRVADLMNEGQLFLDANEPEKALKNFDEALAIEPKHIEALIKKGGALEKLNRIDEVVACYDRAIGLFNRTARYDEALQCYEKALKNSAREKVAA